MSQAKDVLKVRGLSKKFTLHILGGKTIEGCTDVNFSLKTGEFMGIVGPSGAGKSTIIKCIYRTYLSSSGQILYTDAGGEEVDLARAPEDIIRRLRQKEIGYVSQFLQVIPRVPAVDVLAEGLRQRNWDLERARERAREYLAMLNLDRELWDAYPSTFSGGEQQRINLARAIIGRPRLLLLDEPTASLDNETKWIVIRILRELKEQGTSIIGIFHDLEAMRRMVDRIFTMQAGRGDSLMARGEVI